MKISGMKTYAVSIATILYAVGGVIIGKVDANLAIPLVLGAFGAMGLRHGIK